MGLFVFGINVYELVGGIGGVEVVVMNVVW